MHVVAIIAVGWIMIIGAFFFTSVGDIIGVKPEKLATNLYVLFFIFLYVMIVIRKCLLIPSYIVGQFETYAGYETYTNIFRSIGIVHKATFSMHDRQKKFYRNIIFRENIWNSGIKPLCADGVFFIDKSLVLRRIHVWGAQINNKDYIFLGDMNNPSLIVLLLTTCLGLYAFHYAKKIDEPFFCCYWRSHTGFIYSYVFNREAAF